MKIIIDIKETATLARIEELGTALGYMRDDAGLEADYSGFSDVIQSISREK